LRAAPSSGAANYGAAACTAPPAAPTKRRPAAVEAVPAGWRRSRTSWAPGAGRRGGAGTQYPLRGSFVQEPTCETVTQVQVITSSVLQGCNRNAAPTLPGPRRGRQGSLILGIRFNLPKYPCLPDSRLLESTATFH